MDNLIIPLASRSQLLRKKVGGKFFRLAKLARAGFPVPPAFCLSAEALEACIGGRALLRPLAAGVSGEADVQMVRMLIMGREFPPVARRGMEKALMALRPPLVVRSSAVDEDGTRLSFAGMFTSVLGVCHADVEHAVRECWASLWSPRARSYYAVHGVGLDRFGMAVICQELIVATTSGVLFTCDPVSGADVCIINSTWGLPGPVVDGEVTPDLLEMDRRGGVRVRRLGSKLHTAVYDCGEVRTRKSTEGERESFSLGAEQAGRLLSECLSIERLFGVPQDIEWAFRGDDLFILQSRSITTLEH